MNKLALFVLVFLVTGASAFVKIVSPVDIEVQPLGETIISPVGPGHDVILKFQRDTGESIYWDSLALLNQVDEDWKTSTYSDDNYIYYSIKVPVNEPAGVTPFQLKISNDKGLIRAEESKIKVSVTRDPGALVQVLGFEEKPSLFADEPGYAFLKIKNKALSKASYSVNVSFQVLPNAGETYEYSLGPAETLSARIPIHFQSEGIYDMDVVVWTPDNSAIHENATTKVYVKPTLRSKLKNIGQGFPLIPLTMTPFYAVLGLLGI